MRIESLSPTEWQHALQSLPGHACFVAPRFLDSWVRHHAPGARPRAWRVRAASGAWRLCTLVETRTSRFGTTGLIAPEGGYGTAGHGPMEGDWLDPLLQSLQQHRTDSIELVLDPSEEATPFRGRGFACTTQQAWVVDLGGDAQARLAHGLDKRVRRQLRLCEASGVQTQRHGLDALDDFYALYRKALADNPARAAYSRAFLADLIGSTGPGEACLYLTRHEQRLISGGIVLRGGTQAIAWIGCFDRSAAPLHGNLHRHSTVIRDLSQAGVTSYNLGAASGLPQVAHFKQKLGATARPYRVITWRNPLLTQVRRILGRTA